MRIAEIAPPYLPVPPVGYGVTIVHPGTLRRWIREDRKKRNTPAARGRRRTAADIRKLILKLARECAPVRDDPAAPKSRARPSNPPRPVLRAWKTPSRARLAEVVRGGR